MAGAVSQFQESEGLPRTGAVDDSTFARLRGVQSAVRQQEHLGQKDLFVQGEKSGLVARDQRMLASLGYQVGNTQGIYDSQTVSAEEAFRRDDRTPHVRSDQLTPGLAGVLSRDAAALEHSPYFERERPSSNNRKLDSETATAAWTTHPDGKVGIGEGMQGDAVKNVQARLLAAGYDPEGVNGRWDSRTETALKDFQSRSHLPATGRVDSATWHKLDKAVLYARSSTSPAQSLGEHDGAVRSTQKLLRRDGYSGVAVNGLFDGRTERAVASFQRKEHLHANGDVNAKTLSDLKHFSQGPSVDRSKIYLQQPNGWSCAPTSLTMAEAAWGVAKPTDATMFRLAKDMGDGPGTGLPGNASLIAAQARRNGLKATYNSSTQASAVRQALKEGRTCVVNGSLGVGGHFIYIGGLDSHGRFIVFDPDRPDVHTWSDADLNAFTHVGTNPPGFAELWK
jgi:peptidoglycan hydrolase-like protein with peptidoglycan-binding domain